MYVVAQHRITDPGTAFQRGEKLVQNEGAPPGVRGLQFLPATDGSTVVCLYEAPSVTAVQKYVDEALGDSSKNSCFEVNAELAFADRPLGLRESSTVRA